jgi:hypothetical protein
MGAGRKRCNLRYKCESLAANLDFGEILGTRVDVVKSGTTYYAFRLGASVEGVGGAVTTSRSLSLKRRS